MKEKDIAEVTERLCQKYPLLVEREGRKFESGDYWGDLSWRNHDFPGRTVVVVLASSTDESGGGSYNDLDYIQFPLSALESVAKSALGSKDRRDSTLVEGRHVMYHEHWPYGSEKGYTGPRLRCHMRFRVSVDLTSENPTLQIEGPKINYPREEFTDLIK